MSRKIITRLIVVTFMVFSLASCNKEKPIDTHTHKWGEWVTVKEASCKEEGQIKRTCTGCEESETIDLNMTAHKFDEGQITKEATCEEEGSIKFNCSVCLKNVEQKIPTLEHKIVIDQGTLPSCSSTGYSDGSHCELCGTVIKEQLVLEAIGHAWGKEVITTYPTCEKEGLAKVTCGTCKAVSNKTIEALGHHVEILDATEPTCEGAGMISKATCSWCDEVVYEKEIISPIGHNYVDGECVRCQKLEQENGMKFELINGEYYLSEVGVITVPNVIVPTMYNNSYVVGILAEAFVGAEYVNSICLPKTIKYIADGAFDGCRYLQAFILDPENEYYELNSSCIVEKETGILIAGAAYASINDGVKEIASGAFKNRIGVTLIDIPASVEKIAEDAFAGCNNIVLIKVAEGNKVYASKDNCIILKDSNTLLLGCQGSKIPAGTEIIATGAFNGCEMLKEIKIPDTVTTIMPEAFIGCLFVSDLEIPSTVTMLDGAFEGLANLTKVVVSEDNPNYKSVDNCILSKDGKTLVLSNKDGLIPEGVEVIGAGAFAGNFNLKSIVLPETVTLIGKRAFANCTNLTTVTLSPVVTTLGEESFAGCTSFEKMIIPDSVTTIKAGAFTSCVKMQRIELSENISTIEENAFKDCTILIIVCEAKKKPANWHDNYNPEDRPVFWGNYIIN